MSKRKRNLTPEERVEGILEYFLGVQWQHGCMWGEHGPGKDKTLIDRFNEDMDERVEMALKALKDQSLIKSE